MFSLIPQGSQVHSIPVGLYRLYSVSECISFYRLVGKLHVIEVADKAAENPDYGVTVADIEEYETTYGKIQPNSIVSNCGS